MWPVPAPSDPIQPHGLGTIGGTVLEFPNADGPLKTEADGRTWLWPSTGPQTAGAADTPPYGPLNGPPEAVAPLKTEADGNGI